MTHPDIESEVYRREFLENFNKLSDDPELGNLQFDFSTYGEQLARYMTSEDLPRPLTIGINGEWGSGKTTLIKTIQQNIDKTINGTKQPDIIYFDFNAWAAEKTDIVVSLFQRISESLRSEQHTESQINKFKESWVPLLADIALRKWGGGMTYKDAKQHLQKPPPSTTDISDQISCMLEKKRLIIFIDDLDRCNASNILELLETIKNVLSIDNLIFCITVDMKQIERAWELRYNSEVGKIESKEYIEKLFQMIFSLPPKTDDDVGNYIDFLVPMDKEHDKLRLHLIESLTRNPRKIKRMLNIIFFLIQNYDLKNIDINPTADIKKQCQLHFSFIITWVALTINHRKIAAIFQAEPSAIIPITLFFSPFDSFMEFKVKHTQNALPVNITIPKNNIEHHFPSKSFTPTIIDILKIIIEEDQLAFKTLKHPSQFIKNPEQFRGRETRVNYDNEFLAKHYDEESKIFKKITEKGGLVGI